MANWDRATVKDKLVEQGWFPSERRISYATQFTLPDGTRVNCFDTGRVVVQGKDSDIRHQAMALFDEASKMAVDAAASSTNDEASAPPRVFIVYGHDENALRDLELLLRRLKLEPLVLQDIPGAGDTIIEKLESLTNADYACVLVTPDDEGRKRGDGDDLRPRARQNVVLELGMVLAHLGRHRVLILMKGEDIELPSDIQGLIYVRFAENVGEQKNALVANLHKAGFKINVSDLSA